MEAREVKNASFEWIEIPAGQVILEHQPGFYGGGQTFEVSPFAISKYPVTNAQFGEFINADGYHEKRWWTAAGWIQQETEGRTEPRYWTDARFNGSEQPVAGVSWYEAMAFCNWLSEIEGAKHASLTRISLPSETQWQWAASMNDGRIYPWGNQWDGSRCNNDVDKKGFGKTSSVRQFEGQGDSPFGVVDMVGNVWEWCLTDCQSGENSVDGDHSKKYVLRGGSWGNINADLFRVTSRGSSNPPRLNYTFGFRCIRS